MNDKKVLEMAAACGIKLEALARELNIHSTTLYRAKTGRYSLPPWAKDKLQEAIAWRVKTLKSKRPIQERIKKAGIKKSSLAKEIEITGNSISHFFSGRAKLPKKRRLQLESILKQISEKLDYINQ